MRTLVPTPTAMFSGKDYREVVSDPTKNLLSVMCKNSFTRIKTALTIPGIKFGSRDPGHKFQTLLMRVCLLDMAPRYRRDLAKILLEKREVDLNAKDGEGRTALAHACIVGDRTMVKFLADDADLDPNLADREGDTPLMHACRGGQMDVVDTLLTNFVRLGLQVDEPNNQGVTPLIEAARSGNADICRRLVTVGKADVNARDGNSFNTAQDYAIASRRLSTPDILLLSPIAQRKLQARRKREAMGRSSLSELMKRDSFYPSSGWQQQQEESGSTFVLEHGEGKAKPPPQRRTGATALQQEHLQQLNSKVFQMAKYGLSRVAEQRQEEDEQSVEPRRRKISLSLPDLSVDDQDQDVKSTSTNSSDNHLRVTHRFSPSVSPSSSPIPPRSHHPKTSPGRQPPAQSPRLKLPPVDSPNHSPASRRRRGSVPNKAFTGSRPIPTRPSSTASHQLGLSKSPPDNWAPSASHHHSHGTVHVVAANKNKSPPDNWAPSASHHHSHGTVHVVAANKNKSSTRQSWEGKPSSSVPSYLFR